MTAVDLDELAARHARAQAEAEATAAQLAAREAEMLAEQLERRQQWDTEFVASYRDRLAKIDEESRVAKVAFYDAVIADPVVAAWVTMRACRWRRSALISQMASALVRTGQEREALRYSPPDYREPRLYEDVLDIAEDEAQRVATDEDTELVDARERYALEGERS